MQNRNKTETIKKLKNNMRKMKKKTKPKTKSIKIK